MIRILFYLAIVFLVGLGFAWLADRPGDMVVTFDGYQYRVSLMVAAVAVTAIVAAVMISWWLVKAIWNSPYLVSRYFRVRRRDRGYQALSTGMIAAGAGDGALARKMNAQAAKLIRADQEPLVRLLDAQASLLEGDHDGARQKFEAMLDDPEMRLLGLRGLYLEAERLGDHRAARHYAGRAADIAPQLGWAAESTIEEKIATGDWDGALRLVDAQKASRQAGRDATARRKSVLLTAKAMALMDTDPTGARNAALEANRLQPNFVPAAIAAAKTLFRNNDTRKGAKILEAAWKAEPHPEIADLYTHARHGDAVNDRLNRARRLQSIKQNHAESALAVARAELEAGHHAEARKAAEAAIRMRPTESAFLLLADIEEADTGDIGKVRELLGRAVRAPRDPAWIADGQEAEHWAPLSPVTGRLDAFEWHGPVERLGKLVEEKAPAEPKAIAAPPPVPPAPAAEIAVVAPAPAAPEPEKRSEPMPAEPVAERKAAVPPPPANDSAPAAAPLATPAMAGHPVAPAWPTAATPVDSTPPGPEPVSNPPKPAATSDDAKPDDRVEAGDPPPPPLPDDPGVDPAETRPSRRFRLF